MEHTHRNSSTLEQLGAALQFVQDVIDRRLHHQVVCVRVEQDRDRVTNGVAEAAPKLPNAIAVRQEVGSLRRQ